jgi:hypothetical protein
MIAMEIILCAKALKAGLLALQYGRPFKFVRIF